MVPQKSADATGGEAAARAPTRLPPNTSSDDHAHAPQTASATNRLRSMFIDPATIAVAWRRPGAKYASTTLHGPSRRHHSYARAALRGRVRAGIDAPHLCSAGCAARPT